MLVSGKLVLAVAGLPARRTNYEVSEEVHCACLFARAVVCSGQDYYCTKLEQKLWCLLFCFEEENIIIFKDLHYFEYFHSTANFILISLTIKNKLLFFSKSTFPPPSFTHFHQKLLISRFGFISLNTHNHIHPRKSIHPSLFMSMNGVRARDINRKANKKKCPSGLGHNRDTVEYLSTCAPPIIRNPDKQPRWSGPPFQSSTLPVLQRSIGKLMRLFS